MTAAQPSPLAPRSPYGNQPPGPSPAPKKKSVLPKILIVLGAIILALSLAIGITVTVIGIVSTSGGAGDIEVFDGGSGSYTAEEGEVLQYYKQAGTETPGCDITAPSQEAIGDGTNQTSSITLDGTEWESFDSITANEAGEYTVDCFGTPVAIGPPVSIGGIFGAIGGVLIAVGGGFLGVVLLAIGVILVILNKRRATA